MEVEGQVLSQRTLRGQMVVQPLLLSGLGVDPFPDIWGGKPAQLADEAGSDPGRPPVLEATVGCWVLMGQLSKVCTFPSV